MGVVDDDGAVVLVELLADDTDRHVGLAVEQAGALLFGGQRGDLVPLLEQSGDVALDLLAGHVLGRRAHDHAVVGGLHPVEDAARRRLRS